MILNVNKESVLSRLEGGTGISVETTEELLLALGGTSMELIWENASPTSAFLKQTLSKDVCDTDGYTHILIVPLWYTGILQVIPAVLLRRNTKGASTFSRQDVSSRDYWFYSEEGVGFSNGYLTPFSGGLAENNDVHIPFRIYGIKGVN